ncbi:hypothetical protein K2173_004601 [Erythroxylum novogranatense]|uniref:Elongator complex protein 5 n=1 Tax=Erythroxylum novogranatense TaxID=1862640 RepID=A0AAV8T6S7_9ROSI|nr:hypothetical protein K2173_004601 [Erythroxylum novogranatense]
MFIGPRNLHSCGRTTPQITESKVCIPNCRLSELGIRAAMAAETICRTLRDGVLEGELAAALTIKDSSTSPHGFQVFSYVLSRLSSSILASKSQSRAIVIVSFTRNPCFYLEFLKRRELDVVSSHQWIGILDCYTDPLGWRDRLDNFKEISRDSSVLVHVYKEVKDIDKLHLSILELGKRLVGQGKMRFTVAIDSASEMLRHASVSKVAGLVSNLRSHEQISSIFWLLHLDLHEVGVASSLEYVSSMVASTEPSSQVDVNRERADLESPSLREQNFGEGKLHVRFKRRNGRVRILTEEFHIEQSGIHFVSLSSDTGNLSQSLLLKVQFSLQLSEKERAERAKVLLPFEHQGNGKPIQIYDGRRSLPENRDEETLTSTNISARKDDNRSGEIIYYRDSDDEMPDSDEDPDDDLDI